LVVRKQLVGALSSNVEAVDLARIADLANIVLCAAFDWGARALWSGKSGREGDEGEEGEDLELHLGFGLFESQLSGVKGIVKFETHFWFSRKCLRLAWQNSLGVKALFILLRTLPLLVVPMYCLALD
jgi:hypothetical protein